MALKTKLSKNRLYLGVLALLVLLLGLLVGLVLTQKEQEIRERASVPSGPASVNLTPATATYQVGDSFPVSVNFNTGGVAMAGISIRITYPYSGTTPEITASGIQINPALLSSGEWSCPVRTIAASGGIVNIDIGCFVLNTTGFVANSDTQLASFTLSVNSFPTYNPTVLSFDPSQSAIAQKSDNSDILATPTSTGSYQITGGATPTPTATPGSTPTPTPTYAPTATPGYTPSPTPGSGTGGSTASPTPYSGGGTGGTGGSTSTPTPTPYKPPTPTSSPISLIISPSPTLLAGITPGPSATPRPKVSIASPAPSEEVVSASTKVIRILAIAIPAIIVIAFGVYQIKRFNRFKKVPWIYHPEKTGTEDVTPDTLTSTSEAEKGLDKIVSKIRGALKSKSLE